MQPGDLVEVDGMIGEIVDIYTFHNGAGASITDVTIRCPDGKIIGEMRNAVPRLLIARYDVLRREMGWEYEPDDGGGPINGLD